MDGGPTPRRYVRPQAGPGEVPGQADRRGGRLQAVAEHRRPASGWAARGRSEQRGESGPVGQRPAPAHRPDCADDLCVVRSMVGELPLHGQQNLLLHTGRVTGQAPSFGSWVSYGLGTRPTNLPGYVLLNNDWVPNGGLENFGSALPAGRPPGDDAPGRRDAAGQHRARPTRPRSSGASSTCSREQDGAFAGATADRRRDRVGDPATTRRPSGCRRPSPRSPTSSRESAATRAPLRARPARRLPEVLRPAMPPRPPAGRGRRAVRRDHLPADPRQQLALGPARASSRSTTPRTPGSPTSRSPP